MLKKYQIDICHHSGPLCSYLGSISDLLAKGYPCLTIASAENVSMELKIRCFKQLRVLTNKMKEAQVVELCMTIPQKLLTNDLSLAILTPVSNRRSWALQHAKNSSATSLLNKYRSLKPAKITRPKSLVRSLSYKRYMWRTLSTQSNHLSSKQLQNQGIQVIVGPKKSTCWRSSMHHKAVRRHHRRIRPLAETRGRR